MTSIHHRLFVQNELSFLGCLRIRVCDVIRPFRDRLTIRTHFKGNVIGAHVRERRIFLHFNAKGCHRTFAVPERFVAHDGAIWKLIHRHRLRRCAVDRDLLRRCAPGCDFISHGIEKLDLLFSV
jgi:hypothetical protein